MGPMSRFKDPKIYRAILDGLQIEVSVLDMDGKIVFWSYGAEQITGDARSDILGHCCAENILLQSPIEVMIVAFPASIQIVAPFSGVGGANPSS
jgi:PAS domain-containing protein